jgi:S-formylglutathione hydrolase FrmB
VRRRLALAVFVVAALVVAAIGWGAVRDVLNGYSTTEGSQVVRFTIDSRLMHRQLHEVAVVPPGGGEGRPLLVLLHGRSGDPDNVLSDAFFKGVKALGNRAPVILLADGGDHSYWHDRRDGPWGSYVMREAIPEALTRFHANPKRIAVGGFSMGGFGALDLARLAPGRFCAIGGHSAALWQRGGDTPAGAFDDAEDFARHDVMAAARTNSSYPLPIWLDVGNADPFRPADTQMATILRASGHTLQFHVWPGDHSFDYWRQHIAAYLRFYANACA